MRDYFNYDVFYCMNITDIDDKVWRKGKLFKVLIIHLLPRKIVLPESEQQKQCH